jgi:ADP-ribose 1''-phosphate phosphatase
MRDLLRQVAEQRRQGKAVGGLRMCKINSGLFGVKWERTVEVLEGIEVEAEGDGQGSVEVWSMD